MPLLALRCACGHEYAALDSFSTVDESVKTCPKCGGHDLERLVGGGFGFKQDNADLLDDEEVATRMAIKAETEAHAEEILDGRMNMNIAGPKEFHPEVPEHLRKRYY